MNQLLKVLLRRQTLMKYLFFHEITEYYFPWLLIYHIPEQVALNSQMSKKMTTRFMHNSLKMNEIINTANRIVFGI